MKRREREKMLNDVHEMVSREREELLRRQREAQSKEVEDHLTQQEIIANNQRKIEVSIHSYYANIRATF